MEPHFTSIAIYNASDATVELAQALLATIKSVHAKPWLVSLVDAYTYNSDQILYIIVCAAGNGASEKDIALPKHYIAYQLEPTVILERQPYQKLLKGAHAVWDYSPLNVSYLDSLAIPSIHVPVGYHPSTSALDVVSGQRSYTDHSKDIDVLFLGVDTYPRRQKIRNELYSRGLRIWFVCGMGIKQMQETIKRAKICLNLHVRDDMSCLETVRLNVLLSNQACIVSEDFGEVKDGTVEEYSSAVQFSSYDKLVDTCVELVGNFQRRQQLAHQGYQWYLQRNWTDIVPFTKLLPSLSGEPKAE